MCNKRYISKPQNKEIGSVSGKTDSLMSLLSCSHFSGWIPIWSMDAIPRNPSYSASFSPLIFLLHYPFLISLYLWLNMYFSKDADSIPTFESPWIHRGWTPALWFLTIVIRPQDWECALESKSTTSPPTPAVGSDAIIFRAILDYHRKLLPSHWGEERTCKTFGDKRGKMTRSSLNVPSHFRSFFWMNFLRQSLREKPVNSSWAGL